MARPLRVALAIAAIAAIGIAAGCGSDDNDDQGATTAPPATTAPATTAPATTAPAGATVKVDADPNGALAFVQKTLTAPAGADTFVFTDASTLPHNFAIKGNGVDTPPTDTVSGGQSAQLKVTLQPGTYTYYCEIPGHEAGGMKGTLTVQ